MTAYETINWTTEDLEEAFPNQLDELCLHQDGMHRERKTDCVNRYGERVHLYPATCEIYGCEKVARFAVSGYYAINEEYITAMWVCKRHIETAKM